MKIPIEKPGSPAEILEHHGVLGMRWGHRKEGTSGTSSRKVAKGDKKFAKKITNPRKNLNLKIQLHNATGPAMDKFIPEHNAKYAKAINDGTLLNQHSPITKRYFKEYNDKYLKELNIEVNKLSPSPSGTRKYAIAENDQDFLGFSVFATDVKHAVSTVPDSFRVNYVKGDNGEIIGLVLDDSISQGENFVKNFLSHTGS